MYLLLFRSISSAVHTVSSLLLCDSPGFQNPASCGRQTGATFEDLCHNYLQERLQLLFHHTTLVAPKDRYEISESKFSEARDSFEHGKYSTLVIQQRKIIFATSTIRVTYFNIVYTNSYSIMNIQFMNPKFPILRQIRPGRHRRGLRGRL